MKEKKDFLRKKLIEFQVITTPRVNKTGEKAGIITTFSPVIIGFDVIEANEEDTAYINLLSSLEAAPESDSDLDRMAIG